MSHLAASISGGIATLTPNRAEAGNVLTALYITHSREWG